MASGSGRSSPSAFAGLTRAVGEAGPAMPTFRAMCDRVVPRGVFRNDHVRRAVFGVTPAAGAVP